VRAELAGKTLGEHGRDGSPDQERLDAHLAETRQRLRGVVRMQRREDEVARQRSLDRDLRRLTVPDLTHHHDVGVGTQDRPQCGREREAGLLVDLNLVDAAEPVLDRVLDRDDVDLGPVDLGQRSVEGRGLTGARGSGDE